MAADYEEVQSPFVVVSKPEPQVMLTKDLSNVPVDTGIGEVLPDEDALRIISQQFKPFGSLVIGERGVLQLARGQTIAEGESFKAEIRGVAYEVQIMDVTSKSYKLSLGTAEVEKNFFTTTGSNQ